MVHEFALPDVGEGVAEGEIVTWLVEPGDTVTEDQPIAEVETDKALVELPSPVDGTIATLHADEGDVVPVGEVIVTFAVEGETPPEEPDEPDEHEAATDATEAPETHIFAPPRLRREAADAGVDLTTLEGSGPAGHPTAADLARALERPADPETAPERERTAAADRERTLAAPATRRVAREEGVDIDSVPASEQRNGDPVVTAEDVRAHASGEPTELARERREPLSGVRQTIADRMVDSLDRAAHVTHHDTADVTTLVTARERLADEIEGRLTYMPFVIRAVVAALADHPVFNATLDEDAGELVYRNYYNIGVATATDEGLMVPVIEDADRKGLTELASELSELVEQTRERSVAPERLAGSTFTITNVGAIGGEHATPILNRDESGILALGAIERRPRVVTDAGGGESVEPRWTLPLSLSFDHRVTDGADAARFTNTLIDRLEEPAMLLLE